MCLSAQHILPGIVLAMLLAVSGCYKPKRPPLIATDRVCFDELIYLVTDTLIGRFGKMDSVQGKQLKQALTEVPRAKRLESLFIDHWSYHLYVRKVKKNPLYYPVEVASDSLDELVITSNGTLPYRHTEQDRQQDSKSMAQLIALERLLAVPSGVYACFDTTLGYWPSSKVEHDAIKSYRRLPKRDSSSYARAMWRSLQSSYPAIDKPIKVIDDSAILIMEQLPEYRWAFLGDMVVQVGSIRKGVPHTVILFRVKP